MQQAVVRIPAPSRKSNALTVICAVLVAIFIVFVFGAYVIHATNTTSSASTPAQTDSRIAALSAGTTMTSEIPAVLPANGITINDEFVLRPLASLQASSVGPQANVQITASQAIAIGRTYANAQPFAATTLLASVTDINSVSPAGATESARVVQNVPAWVVTFTTTNPQNVIQGSAHKTGYYAPRHFNIVLNASTGAFVLGFFTA
jgi:hypothetical protein